LKRIKKRVFYIVTFLIVVGCIFGGMLFVLKSGKNVQVTWSDKDLQSACKKTYLVYDEKMTSALNIAGENDNTDNNLEATLSSAELTALANKAAQKYNAINDLNIKLENDNIIEMSFTLGNNLETVSKLIPDIAAYKDYLDLAKGSPIYVKASINYEGGNQLSVKVLSLSFGQIQISNNKVDSIALSVLSQLTTDLNDNNVDIIALTINDDMLYYKTTIQ
jgi:hypothetical protein